jgi:hypothetical protein
VRLREWMRANGVRHGPLGERLGLKFPNNVYRYATVPPCRIPRPEIMARLTTITGGQVTADDFYRPPAPEDDLFVWDGRENT